MNDDPKYQPGDAPNPAEAPAGVIISSDTHRANRIPPGQTRTRKWPVLHASYVPDVSRETWSLEVRGLVNEPLRFTWDEFQALPRVKVFSDFHCVTTWSRLGNLWEGVSVQEILRLSGIKPEARYAIAGGFDGGWTTNMPLIDFNVEDALFADTHDGEPINADHGGPVRLIVPRLYAWKSAKWVKSLELTA
ncbi:MAG: molybdopterin-dependent oxidoreductase, partial [Planctomycetaceae bacterium]